MPRHRLVRLAAAVLAVLVASTSTLAPAPAAHAASPTAAPSAVIAVAGIRSASVSWTPPTAAPTAKGYLVVAVDSRSRIVKMTLTGGTPSVTIRGLQPGTRLRFKVAARTGWFGFGPFSALSAPVLISSVPGSCSGSVSASVPGAAAGTPVPVYRSADFDIQSVLTSTCANWTYSWTYRRGSAAAVAVPSSWTGAAAATLTVPKWTLDKFAVAGEDYTFTVSATPPAGSTGSATTASVVVRVLSTTPIAGFVPDSLMVPYGSVYFYALIGGIRSYDPDYPVGDEHLTFQWAAKDLNVAEEDVPVVGGSETSAEVVYDLVPLRSYEFTLTVCRNDDPGGPCAMKKVTASTPEDQLVP